MVNSEFQEIGQFKTVNEVAAVVGVHPITIRRWIKNGQLLSVRVGGRIKVPDSAVQGLVRRGAPKRGDSSVVDDLCGRVERLETTINMLLDELGYGSSMHSYTKKELEALVGKASGLLLKSSWTFKQMDQWAEIVMRMRDEDVLRLTKSHGDSWVPIYTLLSHMRSRVPCKTEADSVLTAKLDKATSHLRSLVYACSRSTDPGTSISPVLRKLSGQIGASPALITGRICSWFEQKYASA